MAEILPSPSLLGRDELWCLALAANGCIESINLLHRRNDPIVRYDFGGSDQPIFNDVAISSMYAGIKPHLYPFLDIGLNGVPRETDDYQFVPQFDFWIDLEPPYAAWFVKTEAVLDSLGEYHPEDNPQPHAPLMVGQEEPITHPAYLTLFDDIERRQLLDITDANRLIEVLDTPKLLINRALQDRTI